MPKQIVKPMDDGERIDVRDDGRIILYKREGLKNPKWQARISIPNASGYKIISTKTTRQSEAERIAVELYHDLTHHVKMGGSLKTKSFAQVFTDWENSLEPERPHGIAGPWHSTVERVRSYALNYFGSKKINEITSKDFENYWLWRKQNYSKRIPTNATLGRERTAILSVFKFALKLGHISQVPVTHKPKAPFQRRPTFTPQEWNVITNCMEEWVEAGRLKSTWRDRFVARVYFSTLAGTGLRVGELRKLKWGDLRKVATIDDELVSATVRGKTGRREVIFNKGVGKLFDGLVKLRKEELKKRYPDQPDKQQLTGSFVICHADGTEIRTFRRSFKSLLDFAKVPVEQHGQDRTTYSLRHFYATEKLHQGLSPYLLAEQMGTSIDMLQRFYGHIITALTAAQIANSSKSKSSHFIV